uniref:Isocitrate dehydrogenase [NAD] subunit, mitochondrial n=1 Tax=Globodera rostochiensis TaxID=31243 RepID=A0A914GYD6_GLORO
MLARRKFKSGIYQMLVKAFSRRLLPSLIKSSRFLTITAPVTRVPEIAEKLRCTLIPGDGVGPELVYAVQDIVKATGIPIDFEEVFLSEVYHSRSVSIDDVVESIARNNCVALKGVIQSSLEENTEGLNTLLRKRLDLFANVVHIKAMEGIRTRHNQMLDFVIIREQTEGEYSRMEHELVPGVIECLKIMTFEKCERVAKFAFDYATKHGRKKVTAVHKANIMKLGDGLFLNVCTEMAKLYPKIQFEHMIIDNCCMQLVARPEQFDVMVMPNLYGNIIDNLAAGLVGGAGVVNGESVGSNYMLFEPGSRHTFTGAFGRQIANPTAMILCCANMLNHLHLDQYGWALRQSVEKVIREGKVRTRDLGGYASTGEFVNEVIDNFQMN